jgi:hypothetical protein
MAQTLACRQPSRRLGRSSLVAPLLLPRGAELHLVEALQRRPQRRADGGDRSIDVGGKGGAVLTPDAAVHFITHFYHSFRLLPLLRRPMLLS